MPSTTPQQSTRGFVSPSTMPVKRTPDVSDICSEKAENSVRVRSISDVQTTEESPSQFERVVSQNENVVVFTELAPAHFENHWQTMFHHVFASVPTIFIPLKDTLPEIENNIITVSVKNEIQKEHFEAKIREVLEYMRTHFNEEVEDIIVKTNELLETKKIIYDVKDKLQNFNEENEEFEHFLQILDLKIKD